MDGLGWTTTDLNRARVGEMSPRAGAGMSSFISMCRSVGGQAGKEIGSAVLCCRPSFCKYCVTFRLIHILLYHPLIQDILLLLHECLLRSCNIARAPMARMGR